VPGNDNRFSGFVIEDAQVSVTADSEVVIAPDAKQVGQLAYPLNALVAVWSVTNQVSQAPHNLIIIAGIREDGFKRSQVGVHIRNHQDFHFFPWSVF